MRVCVPLLDALALCGRQSGGRAWFGASFARYQNSTYPVISRVRVRACERERPDIDGISFQTRIHQQSHCKRVWVCPFNHLGSLTTCGIYFGREGGI